MLSWGQQRKFMFVGAAILFAVIVIGGWTIIHFHRAPNCFDKAQNGDERGVDCGGKCVRVCKEDTKPLLVHFARTLEVADGVWGAVASVENRNTGAGAKDVPYVFKLYDAENLLLYERHGTAFVPPRKVFAVFEGKMASGDRTPVRATFAWEEQPVFERMDEPELLIRTKGFTTTAQGSTLEATITNPSRTGVRGIEATALLFDESGDVIGASATVLKQLSGEGSAVLTFTWPRELQIPARMEILYAVPGK